MQIREQGRQVQLIRSPYDKSKKKCVQKVVHKFERRYEYPSADISNYLSPDQIADLSDDEAKTLSEWLKSKVDKKQADDRKYSIEYADNYISKAGDAILSDGVSAEKAKQIWEAMEKLGKTLKKAGHPKPQPRKTAQKALEPAIEGQAQLPLGVNDFNAQ